MAFPSDLALTRPPVPDTTATEKTLLTAIALGLLALLTVAFDGDAYRARLSFWAGVLLLSGGTLSWAWYKFGRKPAGVQQDNLWLRSSTSRGAVAWVTAVVLTGFYVVLYWFSGDNGQGNFGPFNQLVHALDPFSQWLRQRPADQWFLYGTFYTLAVLVMGARPLEIPAFSVPAHPHGLRDVLSARVCLPAAGLAAGFSAARVLLLLLLAPQV